MNFWSGDFSTDSLSTAALRPRQFKTGATSSLWAHPTRVMCDALYLQCPCLSGAAWCLQPDVMPDPRPQVLTWGHGGHGNLGHGDRKSRRKPKRVEGALGGEIVVQAACTRGQVGCKGGMTPKQGGAEGPHTCVITASGQLYTFGTCHKGLLYVCALL